MLAPQGTLWHRLLLGGVIAASMPSGVEHKLDYGKAEKALSGDRRFDAFGR